MVGQMAQQFSKLAIFWIVAALPDHLKDVARFCYRTGWWKTLRWADVDRDGELAVLIERGGRRA
jgi:hypothetical protein